MSLTRRWVARGKENAVLRKRLEVCSRERIEFQHRLAEAEVAIESMMIQLAALRAERERLWERV